MKAILQLALEALESCGAAHITDGGRQWYDEKLVDTAYAALQEALAQPEQEPVAIVDDAGIIVTCSYKYKAGDKLYTTPPQRKPLTDEQIKKMRHLIDWTAGWSYNTFARAIEAAHGIKE